MKVLCGRDSQYKLLDLINVEEKEFLVSDLKPLVFDAALIGIAQHDSMEYFFNIILEHRGNLKKKTVAI